MAIYSLWANGQWSTFVYRQKLMDSYNDRFNSEGGKVLLQKYERWSGEISDDDSDDFISLPNKKRKIENGKPLVLVACTPPNGTCT